MIVIVKSSLINTIYYALHKSLLIDAMFGSVVGLTVMAPTVFRKKYFEIKEVVLYC